VELDSDGKLLMEAEVEQNASSLPVVKKEEHSNNDDVKMDGATAEQMAELQKQVRTLEEVSKSRDEQITKVRFYSWLFYSTCCSFIACDFHCSRKLCRHLHVVHFAKQRHLMCVSFGWLGGLYCMYSCWRNESNG
jgi:hypothetical protein